MEPHSTDVPLVVIVGQTASGKSALAMELALSFGGQIIAADSRTVYRGMDIGTAKPSNKDRERVPHYLIDITTPDQRFTVADFKVSAQQAIETISSKQKIPFLVGGAGLYVDSLLFDFDFRQEGTSKDRARYSKMSVNELRSLIKFRNLVLPENVSNPRHLIRVLEADGQVASHKSLRQNTLVLGVVIDKVKLQARITRRIDDMLQRGLELEVRELAQAYGWNCAPLQTIGYQEFKELFDGGVNHNQLRQLIISHTNQYAKRQRQWFSRNSDILWISNMEEAVDAVTTFLNK